MRAPSFHALRQRFARPPRRTVLALVAVGIAGAGLAVPALAHAAITDFVLYVLNSALRVAINFLGSLLVAMVHVLIAIVQYNDFLHAPAVERGWVIVRDVGNMFFIVVLIIIAFGSILRIQGYRYNQWLFRIVLMALLVNFSKTISGFFIDVAQVVMLTFVNAFRDTAAGNFTELFGITKLLQLRDQSTVPDNSSFAIVTTLVLAVVFLVVALAVTVVYVVMFLVRIVALWFLVVLSPMAYVLNTFKQGEGYAHQWWTQFGRYLTIGPILAFFLWLALTITAIGTSASLGDQLGAADRARTADTGEMIGAVATEVGVGIGEVGSSTNILNFIAGIVILVGALGVVSKMGGIAGSAANNVRTRLGKAGSAVARNRVVQTSLGLATGGAAGMALATYGAGRGTAKRAALGGAIGGLGLASRLPIVGGSFAAVRSKMLGSRLKAEDKERDSVRHMTLDDQIRVAGGLALSETARNRKKLAIEELFRKDHFSKENVRDYEKLVYAKRTRISKTFPDGKTEPNFRTTMYADEGADKILANVYARYPGMDPERKEWEKYGKGEQYWGKRTLSEFELIHPDILLNDDSGTIATRHSLQRYLQALAAAPKGSIEERKLGQIGQRMNPDIVKALFATPAPPPPVPLADIDPEKYRRTRDRAAWYRDQTGVEGAFFDSAEYRQGADQFISRAELEQAEQNRARGVRELGGMASFASGASDTVGFDSRTFANGKYKDAGNYITDEQQKRAFAQDYIRTVVDPEIQKIEARVAARTGTEDKRSVAGEDTRLKALQGARARLQSPDELKNLQIVNQGRLGYSDRHVIAHERTHAKLDAIDPDKSFRSELLDSLPPELQDQIIDDVRRKMGNVEMSDEDAFDEYLTEGLTNAFRSWADEAPDAVKLAPGVLAKLQGRAEESGAKRFAVSGETPAQPELAEAQRTGGGLESALRALGYGARAAAAKKYQDTFAPVLEPVTRTIRGVAAQLQTAQEQRENVRMGGARDDARHTLGELKDSRSKAGELRTFEENLKRGAPIQKQYFKRRLAELKQQRDTAVRSGNLAETNRLTGELGVVDDQHAKLDKSLADAAKEREQAEQKVVVLENRAQESLANMAKVVGVPPLTPPPTVAPTPVTPAAHPSPTAATAGAAKAAPVAPPPPPPQPKASAATTATPAPKFETPYTAPLPPPPGPTTSPAPQAAPPQREPEKPKAPQAPPVNVELPSDALRQLSAGAESLQNAARELHNSINSFVLISKPNAETGRTVTDGLDRLLDELRKRGEVAGTSPVELESLQKIREELERVRSGLTNPAATPTESQALHRELGVLTKAFGSDND